MINKYKKPILLLTMIVLASSCTNKETDRVDRAIKIVETSYYVYEPNPMYKEDARKVNELFLYTLRNRNKLGVDEQRKIYNQAMSQSGKDALVAEAEDDQAIEDSVDERRGLITQSICLSTAALVSAPDDAIQYFNDARGLLTNDVDGSAHEYLEEEYSATFILEILYLHEHNMLRDEDKRVAVKAINELSSLSSASKRTIVEIIANL